MLKRCEQIIDALKRRVDELEEGNPNKAATRLHVRNANVAQRGSDHSEDDEEDEEEEEDEDEEEEEEEGEEGEEEEEEEEEGGERMGRCQCSRKRERQYQEQQILQSGKIEWMIL